MAFFQAPPALGNQYDDDQLLKDYLARVLPADQLADLEPQLRELGARAGGDLFELQLADRRSEPVLTQWDAWGNRIDRIELTAVWAQAHSSSPPSTAWSQRHTTQTTRPARAHPSVRAQRRRPAVAGRLLLPARDDRRRRAHAARLGQPALSQDRAVPRLTSRDPQTMWTSGQWMTERTGGSDVGQSRDGRAPRHRRAGACTARSGSPRRRPPRWRSRWRVPKAPARAAAAWRCSTSRSAMRRARSTTSASTGSRTSSARARCPPPS